MADKRMLTKKVTDNDNFISLSSSAQALYLHLSMSADDDGFSNQVTLSMFKAHASTQDLEALLEKRYIYQFESGVIVIKHWRMANALRKDRYTPTTFKEELAQLQIKDNGSYTWLPTGCQMVAERLPDGCRMVADWLPQNSIDKISIDKCSIESNEPAEPFNAPTIEQVRAYCDDKHYGISPERFVDYYTAIGWVNAQGNPIRDWKAAVRGWWQKEKERNKPDPNPPSYDLDEIMRYAIENA